MILSQTYTIIALPKELMSKREHESAIKMSLDDIISLDVGGTRFDTTRQTLVKDPNSMLARMFDPASKMKPGMFL